MKQTLTTQFKSTAEFWESLCKYENQNQIFLSGESSYTYSDLVTDIKKTTSVLRDHNIAAGDSVIVLLSHEYHCPQLFLSNYFNGVCTVILDPESKSEFIKTVISQTKPKLIFCDSESSEIGLITEIPVIVVKRKIQKKGSLLGRLLGSPVKTAKDNSLQGILDSSSPLEPSLNTDNQNAYILYTSGTTSSPKGVVISHTNLNAHLTTLSKYFGYTSSDKILNLLPYHHVDGFVQGPVLCAFNCATLVRPFIYSIAKSDDIFNTIRLNRVTHFITVPTMLSLLYPFYEDEGHIFNYPEFKFIVSAAGKLESKLWDNFQTKFSVPIANLFGLTESVTGSLYCGPASENYKLGSIGKPVDCRVRIIDQEGKEVSEPDIIGELCISGEHIMLGYIDNPTATSDVLKDGWLHTGDLVRKDADGFFWITGRKKSVIIRGGINVYPEELTEILNTVENIRESVTFGIEDERWGEQVISCVVLKESVPSATEKIYETLRLKLPSEKIPNEIVVLNDLPKGPSGKVIISKTKELLNSLKSTESVSEHSADHTVKLIEIAATVFKVPVSKLSGNSSPENTPGWDSLGHMSFISAIEKSFSIKLTMKDVMKIETIGHAEKVIKTKHNK